MATAGHLSTALTMVQKRITRLIHLSAAAEAAPPAQNAAVAKAQRATHTTHATQPHGAKTRFEPDAEPQTSKAQPKPAPAGK